MQTKGAELTDMQTKGAELTVNDFSSLSFIGSVLPFKVSVVKKTKMGALLAPVDKLYCSTRNIIYRSLLAPPLPRLYLCESENPPEVRQCCEQASSTVRR